ncbi:uncharacterized protein LOC133333189 [Musca vetustissima]|uniref:uncharacterized protein LOC133333189 n=1 Tax=Musca vetustissima TaxID=27455 RepID=UPI002AB69F01|nr:uncharacterized protein LOC133333189 [Musca vetustissima]
MLSFISPSRCKVEVTNFQDRAGVFYEEVAAVGLSKTSWNIVAHVNLEEYVSGIKAFDEAMQKFNVELERMPQMKGLSGIPRLQEAHDRLTNQHDLIMSSAPVRRSRRSALPFVGGVFHSLFGLMDEDHADNLVERINMVEHNQKFVLELLNNQTSLQEITKNILKEQNNAVFKDIEKLSDAFLSVEKEISVLDNRSRILARIAELLTAVQEVDSIQKNLIGVMVNIRGSFLHDVLPVKEFKKQIKIINTSVGKKLHLPTESPIELAKVAEVTTRTTKEYLLFNIRLPLINVDQFTAYAIHSYPIIQDDLSVQLRIQNNLILLDDRKTLFYALKEEEFARCQKVADLTICKQTHPVYNIRESSECEVRLLNNCS